MHDVPLAESLGVWELPEKVRDLTCLGLSLCSVLFPLNEPHVVGKLQGRKPMLEKVYGNVRKIRSVARPLDASIQKLLVAAK